MEREAFLTFSKAAIRDPRGPWTSWAQQENHLVQLFAFHGHVKTWPDGSQAQAVSLARSGCRHWGHLCYSTSRTAFYAFLHQCWVRHVFLNVRGVPCIFREKDTVLLWKFTETRKVSVNMQSSASHASHAVNMSSFNTQHKQNLGGIEFKILKFKKKMLI